MNLLVNCLCADFPVEVGRFDASSVTDETLLELLVGGFENKERFYDEDGIFKDLSNLRGISITSEGEIERLKCGGQRFGGTLHFEYFPRDLKGISLWSNNFYGEFIAKLIPSSAYAVFVGRNNLTGSLVFADLSDNLKSIGVDRNSLSGTLDFEHLPASLIQIKASENRFSGRVDLSLIENPVEFDFENTVSDFVWMGIDLRGNALYIDLQGNKDIKGDVAVHSLENLRHFKMFDRTGVTGILDRNGKRRAKESFPDQAE